MYGIFANVLSAAEEINSAATSNSITNHDPTKLFIALIVALFAVVVYLLFSKIKNSKGTGNSGNRGGNGGNGGNRGGNGNKGRSPVQSSNNFDGYDGKIEIRRKNSGLVRGEIPLKQASVSFGRATEDEKAQLQYEQNKLERFIHDSLDDMIRVPFVDDASYPGYKSVSRYNFYIQYMPEDGYRLFAESPQADHVPQLPVDVNGNIISGNGVIYERNGHLLRNGDTIRIGRDGAYVLKVHLKIEPAGDSGYDSFGGGNDGTVGGATESNMYSNPVSRQGNPGTVRFDPYGEGKY